MSDRAQELAGKAVLAAVFACLLSLQTSGLMRLLAADPKPDWWGLTLIAQSLSLAFVALVVFMTIRRMPPRSTAHGLLPRFAAVAGTFALMGLMFLPSGDEPLAAKLFATLLIVIGTAGSIWCLRHLGRSFSIVAQARKLVTNGPYGMVRHPLYLAEGITTIGIIIMHWSTAAVALGIIQMALQYWRMQIEEQVLRDAFPEYEDYAMEVGMIWPRWQATVRSANG
jgi:protein-S-isoprenylcysteine O-methyltransferase Ste14